METVTITKISKKKIKTKYGEKMSIGIQTKEHNDKWIGGFENENNKGWKIGDKINIEIVQNGKYTNFKIPNEKLTEKGIREIIKEEMDKRFKGLKKYLEENYRTIKNR